MSENKNLSSHRDEEGYCTTVRYNDGNPRTETTVELWHGSAQVDFVTWKGGLSLSIEQAKALILSLNAAVEAYEEHCEKVRNSDSNRDEGQGAA